MRRCKASVHDALYRDRGGFAAADAERRDAAVLSLVAQCVDQRAQDARPTRAQWVAERDGSPAHVDHVGVEIQRPNDSHRLGRERLVQLEQVDVPSTPAGPLQCPRDSRDRTQSHNHRIYAGRRVGHDVGQRLPAEFARPVKFVLSGFLAWGVWRVNYLMQLVGTRNRGTLLVEWLLSYFSRRIVVDIP